jgi:hypothetical protein
MATTSSTEPRRNARTGVPQAIASIIESPNGYGQSIRNIKAKAWPRKSLFCCSSEDGLTGRIINCIEEAAVALPRVMALDRRAVRRRFEERFTATRMANDYVRVYNALLTQEHAKLVTNQVNPLFETAAEPTAEPIEMVHDDLGTSSAAHTW